MTWQIRMIEAPTFDVGADGKNGFQRLEIGDAWFAPHLLEPEHAARASESLAPNYFRDWAGKRPPILVALPYRSGPGIGSHFCVDGSFWRSGEAYGDGWVVTGEAPLLTLSPSVNIGGQALSTVERTCTNQSSRTGSASVGPSKVASTPCMSMSSATSQPGSAT